MPYVVHDHPFFTCTTGKSCTTLNVPRVSFYTFCSFHRLALFINCLFFLFNYQCHPQSFLHDSEAHVNLFRPSSYFAAHHLHFAFWLLSSIFCSSLTATHHGRCKSPSHQAQARKLPSCSPIIPTPIIVPANTYAPASGYKLTPCLPFFPSLL